LYNWERNNFINFQIENSPDFFINSIGSDNHGNLWLGTKTGLYYFNVESKKYFKTNVQLNITRIDVKYPNVYITTEGDFAAIYNIKQKTIVEEINCINYDKMHSEDASLLCMFIDKDSTFWMGGKGKIYAYKNNKIEVFNIPLGWEHLIQD
jgi:ligand-binding sensor domain-containing protein